MGRFQPVVTGGSAQRQLRDGSAVPIQEPNGCQEEAAELQATGQGSYDQREQARTRLWELLHPGEPRLAYKKRTESVGEGGAQ